MRIAITGSIAYDYIMSFPGQFKDHILVDKLDSLALSFLVESMTRHRGGVAPNIGYTLALLGERPVLLATAGQDFDDYRAWLEAQGVDCSGVKVFRDIFTASFFAGKDRVNGQIALFYPGAMGRASEVSFGDLAQRPDFAIISPDDPAAMAKHLRECLDLGLPYAYDVSWQLARLTADEIVEGVLGCAMLVVNDYEMSLITDKTGLGETDARLAGKIVAVTRGENGATIYAGGARYDIPAVPPERILDPTGAGDAFRGGLLRGMTAGWDWGLAGRMGALAATYCLEQLGPQNHHYTRAEFVRRYREHFDDAGVLDALL
ncbi:MAG: carbohydrate kinase family protein [Anaerolineales bacterium]|nr:carbohydrate kinase family protein [Anaerolineales bacterium]